jgi:hypothetical protein
MYVQSVALLTLAPASKLDALVSMQPTTGSTQADALWTVAFGSYVRADGSVHP